MSSAAAAPLRGRCRSGHALVRREQTTLVGGVKKGCVTGSREWSCVPAWWCCVTPCNAAKNTACRVANILERETGCSHVWRAAVLLLLLLFCILSYTIPVVPSERSTSTQTNPPRRVSSFERASVRTHTHTAQVACKPWRSCSSSQRAIARRHQGGCLPHPSSHSTPKRMLFVWVAAASQRNEKDKWRGDD